MIVQDNRGSNAGSLSILPKNPTWQQVVNLFKLKVREDMGWTATPVNQACWRFVGVTLQEGPAVYRMEVWNEAGDPYPGILVARHFSTAPQFKDPISPPYYSNGEANFTEAGGDKFGAREFGYSGGSVTGPDGGPDSFWVSASPPGQQPQYSDLAEGFGWLGGTNHFNPSPIFQYQVKSNGGDVPPVVITGHYVLANLDEAGRVVGYIPFIDGPIPENVPAGRLVILKDGEIVGYQEWQK